MQKNTIAAIATPLAVGGISIIRISGENAIEIADRVFKAHSGVSLKEKKGYSCVYGTVSGIDESIATVFRMPKSYTGEDVVELSCHGGIYITREVLRAVIENGARLAEPGEFTKRAFLNGKMSLTQAEAVMDMISSKNRQAMYSAKAELDGALYKRIDKSKRRLLELAGHLAAWVDYPEEDIEEIECENIKETLSDINSDIDALLKTFSKGKLIKEGIDTVIVGKPNVGKSSLMNLITGTEKSIVTNIAGTTRDVIEESVMLGETMLKLSDTAGIRETEDTVERVGVDIAKKRLENAALVLVVFDSSSSISQEDISIVEKVKRKDCISIAVVNKSDLERKIDMDYLKERFNNIVEMSAVVDDDTKLLENIIEKEVGLNNLDAAAGIISNERQRECTLQASVYIREALAALDRGMTLDAVTVSIESAIESIMELTGERITTELANQVFSNFCVGK